MTSTPLTTTVVTTPPLTVDQLYKPASTPGNVGLCLSGGGTRACCAGMGQLRALAHLTANGTSLLGQIKAMSTVSGGSWLGVPYQFLPAAGPTDAAYLGTYDADQGALTLADLSTLPAGNAGVPMTSFTFSLVGLAGTAVLLFEVAQRLGTPLPADLLWQLVIAMNILSAYGLLDLGADSQPQDLFSATATSLAAITKANPSLAGATAYLFADQVGSGRTQRPFLVCNMGEFVNVPGLSFQLLAPVQATGLIAGVVGAPADATDANGLAVGGGGVDAFAFASAFSSLSGTTATVTQARPWSLTDIVGTSSAAFAETVQNQIAQWAANPLLFLKWLWSEGEAILKWIESHLPGAFRAEAAALIEQSRTAKPGAPSFSFPDITSLIPQYPSWPAGAPAANAKANQFADGGSLENNGLASLLSYSDLDSVIVCVNTEIPMTTTTLGISNGQGGWVPGTNVGVDPSLPPLFGYQPYDDSRGYVTYAAGGASPENQLFANSQVFPTADFAGFLQGLWASAGSANAATSPAIFAQSLVVQANAWFGVPAASAARTIVWVYLGLSSDWTAQFAANQPVAALVASEVAQSNFPHYDTLSTELSATQINLLAHLTSWAMVTADGASQVFSGLFTAGAAR